MTVVPAEGLTRASGAQDGGDARREIDEVEGVIRRGGQGVIVDPILDRLLDLGIRYLAPASNGRARLRIDDGSGADASPVPNGVVWHAVLAQEVDERTGQNEVEELI